MLSLLVGDKTTTHLFPFFHFFKIMISRIYNDSLVVESLFYPSIEKRYVANYIRKDYDWYQGANEGA
jgi:hypothetical protein